MSGNYQGFILFSFIPKGKEPNLKATVICSELPDFLRKFLQEFWIIRLFCQIDIVEDFSYNFWI